ncbi:MAG: hypothetical protein IJM90_03385 [Firmicutes bacterium]|nr:hypothetical protein [Bacillota bacterium]
MKVLILSCNTGGGHNAAGLALMEEFRNQGIVCEFKDVLSFAANSSISRKASSLYVNITTKLPLRLRLSYHPGAGSTSRRKSPVYSFNSRYAKALGAYIQENHFDTVIMHHLFPAEAITYLQRHQLLQARTYFVATDYTCIPFTEETEADYYIIPHRELQKEYLQAGVPYDKIVPLGIPLQRPFSVKRDRTEARTALGLPTIGKMVLIMTGSMDYGYLGKISSTLYHEYGDRLNLVLLCGSSESVKENLGKRFRNNHNVILVGATDQVSLYMDAADLIISKPGGLIATEAAAKKLPMILTDPIPGCEAKNASFFKRHKMALVPDSEKEYLPSLRRILDESDLRESLQEGQKLAVNPLAAASICGFIMAQDPRSGSPVTVKLSKKKR